MLFIPWGGILIKLMGIRGVNPESFKQTMQRGRPIVNFKNMTNKFDKKYIFNLII